MTRQEAVERLRNRQSDLRRAGVSRLYLFGSTARNQAGPESDVDLFFDYDRPDFGLFALMDVKAMAADILANATDIMSRDSLHPMLRERIEESAVRVF